MSETEQTADNAAIEGSGATYVKKLTAAHGWQRRLDATDPQTGKMVPVDPQPYMRIAGAVTEGWLEMTDTTDYVRLIGVFQADVVTKDGSIQTLVSRNLIFPLVVDTLLPFAKVEKKVSTVKGRTDQHFVFADDFSSLQFVYDVWIKQPAGVTRLGFDYDLRVLKEPSIVSHFAHLIAPIGQLIPADAHEPDSAPADIGTDANAPPADMGTDVNATAAGDQASERSEPTRRRRHG